uniref:Mitochondria-eating protein n=1 Tax=Otolemur garnettii TaxID=30611 RepID=H0XVP4_OTOGA
MAENLRRLVSHEALRTLQAQLDTWLREYNTNTCDQNLNYCLEIIEQVAKVQGQLFGILTTAAQEGGHNDGVETIKSRLLPWLEASFTAASMGKPVDSRVPSLQDTFDRERHKDPIQRDREAQLDSDLNATRNQLNKVQDDLAETEKNLEETRNRSAISLLAAEEEINQLKKHIKKKQTVQNLVSTPVSFPSSYGCYAVSMAVSPHILSVQRIEKLGRVGDFICDQLWRSDVCQVKPVIKVGSKASLRGSVSERASLPCRCGIHEASGDNAFSQAYPCYLLRRRTRVQRQERATNPSVSLADPCSPTGRPGASLPALRLAAALAAPAYSQARLDAQCLLRRCINNAETVQRIIYIATVEAFHVAKMAFRHFKIRVRKSLTPSYAGSNDFENAVSDYVVCHLDMYDPQSSVNDVIRAMNINPKISFPPEVDFCLLSDFIREICCIAFSMQTLEPPLDIAFGADGELFNDYKYRRSYDSDFTAPLVLYHVWPALMENDCVIMKGEAVTRRGAFWNSVRPVTRCRSRSLSPICSRSRIGLSTISRSRSPSPIRCGLSGF